MVKVEMIAEILATWLKDVITTTLSPRLHPNKAMGTLMVDKAGPSPQDPKYYPLLICATVTRNAPSVAFSGT